jgi:hypothetical protein
VTRALVLKPASARYLLQSSARRSEGGIEHWVARNQPGGHVVINGAQKLLAHRRLGVGLKRLAEVTWVAEVLYRSVELGVIVVNPSTLPIHFALHVKFAARELSAYGLDLVV